MYIYRITNSINKKFYIGLTTQDVEKRFKQHVIESKKGTNQTICCAIRKYGKENFIIETIETCINKKELLEKEKFWIKKLRAKKDGYNETDGGEGVLGYVISEEQREKLRNSANKRFEDVNERTKISNGLKKYYKENEVSKETRQKLSISSSGRKHSEKTKLKMSISNNGISRNKGIKKSLETRKRMSKNNANKKECKIQLEDKSIKIFESKAELSRCLNIPYPTIKWAIKNANGYINKYNITILE